MQTQICATQTTPKIGQSQSGDWMVDGSALLPAAISHLDPEQAALGAILEATSLLRRQVDTQPATRHGPVLGERLQDRVAHQTVFRQGWSHLAA